MSWNFANIIKLIKWTLGLSFNLLAQTVHWRKKCQITKNYLLELTKSLINFYFTIQGMVKYCNRAWKKWVFFPSFFRKMSKTAETILIKKIGRNHGVLVYKKAQISEHRKNYIFRDNNCFVKMSVSLLVRTLPIFVDALAQKLVWTSKRNSTCSFGALRLRAD